MAGGPLGRVDLQQLADTRLREAGVLLDAGEYSGAYYLSGYAVECALKACICRQYPGDAFPSKGADHGNAYIHNLRLLIHEAELTAAFRATSAADPAFRVYWATVAEWTEQSRYAVWQEREARQLYEAVSHAGNGVLQWLRQHW